MKHILIFGGIILDRYIKIDKYPKKTQTAYISKLDDKGGGYPFQIALCIKELGMEPYLISAVGSDECGNKIINSMQEMELPVNCIKQVNGESGFNLIFIDSDNEHTFFKASGCESMYSNDLIPEKIEKNCNIAIVTGNYLSGNTSTVMIEKLKVLKQDGYRVIFDPVFLGEKIDRGILNEAAFISNIIIATSEEAEYLTRNLEFSKARNNIKIWALELNEMGIDIIIKKYPKGGELYTKGKRITFDSIKYLENERTSDSIQFTAAIAFYMSKGVTIDSIVIKS